MQLKRQNIVIYDDGPHTYFNTRTQLFMESVSSVKKKIKMPFDRQGISMRTAGFEAQKTGEDVKVIQQRILAKWDNTRDIANIRGTHIHKIIEDCAAFLKEKESVLYDEIYKRCGKETYFEAVKTIIFSLRKYYAFYPELLVFSEKYNVAGTIDAPGVRQSTPSSLVDIGDYKTYECTFDSIDTKKEIVKHYNKFFLPPFDYLEESKYMELVIQLSIYGVLFEETYPGIRPGKLMGYNIDHSGQLHPLPVPYMKMEAIAILENNLKLKTLPVLESVGGSQPTAGSEDW